MSSYHDNQEWKHLRAALAYAKRGRPVFPCKAGGKEPLTKRGHLDATTDPRRIHMWWKRWPHANIGIPTGRRSGIFALDVDQPAALDALEAEHGELPATRSHSTGSGGMHFLFKYPEDVEIRNSAGKLAEGLDVRGEGGYIIAPPSRTTRPYEVLDRLPLAEPPAGLLEPLTRPHSNASGKVQPITTAASISPEGPPIPEGSRDDQLTRVAGRLHDGTRSLDDLAAELLEVNSRRCEPPLADAQVLKIARSIHGREPCGRVGVPNPAVLKALEEIETDLYERDRAGDFKGMGGKSERDAIVAAIRVGRERGGQLIPGGIRISVSVREWAIRAAVSKRAMLDYWKKGERKPGIISRLKRRGVARSDNEGRAESEAGAIVLVRRAGFHHSSTGLGARGGGETLRAPRLRWSAPRFDRVGDEIVRSTVRRLGKGCGAVVDALEAAGGSSVKRALADALGIRRIRDLQRRYLDRLQEAAVVECSGDMVTLAHDYLDAIDREREISGEIEAERRDRDKYERERHAYRERRENPPSAHYVNVGADGVIEDLGRVPALDEGLRDALREFLRRNPDRRYETPSWLSVALWAEEYTLGKVPPVAVELVLADLRGEAA
jgi:hypothetical protein